MEISPIREEGESSTSCLALCRNLQTLALSPVRHDAEDDDDSAGAGQMRWLAPPTITLEDVVGDTASRSPGNAQRKAWLPTPHRTKLRAPVAPSPRASNHPFALGGIDHFPSLDPWLQQRADASGEWNSMVDGATCGAPAEEEFAGDFEWSIDGKANLVRSQLPSRRWALAAGRPARGFTLSFPRPPLAEPDRCSSL
jgi:hypothetical protein